MVLTAVGGLPGRIRDSARARYLTAGSLVVISAVSVPLASGALSAKERVLAASADLPAGHVLSNADFTLVNAEAPSSFVVPASQLGDLLGKTLRAEVPKDALLTAGDVGSFPPVGMAEVALTVRPGQFPPGLLPGQQVAVVPPLPSTGEGIAQPASAAPPVTPAVGRVVSVVPDTADETGSSVVELLVPAGGAAAVAAAAGASLVGLDAAGDVQ